MRVFLLKVTMLRLTGSSNQVSVSSLFFESFLVFLSLAEFEYHHMSAVSDELDEFG
jgi:hypothetical protein